MTPLLLTFISVLSIYAFIVFCVLCFESAEKTQTTDSVLHQKLHLLLAIIFFPLLSRRWLKILECKSTLSKDLYARGWVKREALCLAHFMLTYVGGSVIAATVLVILRYQDWRAATGLILVWLGMLIAELFAGFISQKFICKQAA